MEANNEIIVRTHMCTVYCHNKAYEHVNNKRIKNLSVTVRHMNMSMSATKLRKLSTIVRMPQDTHGQRGVFQVSPQLRDKTSGVLLFLHSVVVEHRPSWQQ